MEQQLVSKINDGYFGVEICTCFINKAVSPPKH